MIGRCHPDRPVLRRERNPTFDLGLILCLRVRRVPDAHRAQRARPVRRRKWPAHQLGHLEFIGVVLLRDLPRRVRNGKPGEVSRIGTASVGIRILMQERIPEATDHRLRSRRSRKHECRQTHDRDKRTKTRHCATCLHGCTAHFEPSGSFWNSELMKNGVFRYSGSMTVVVSVNQSLPVGSWNVMKCSMRRAFELYGTPLRRSQPGARSVVTTPRLPPDWASPARFCPSPPPRPTAPR